MLAKSTIEIWQANLDECSQFQQTYWSVLSPDEQQRANRLVKPQDKSRFVVARGILRYLLGQYLNLKPQAIIFDYLARGKPILAASHHCSKLQFNVSHSQQLALYAFVQSDYGIGIDVEWVRAIPNFCKMVQRFLTQKESAYLLSLPPSLQQTTFFQFWTAKEAYLKAIGKGLVGLQDIDVTLSSSDSEQLMLLQQPSVTLYNFSPQPNFLATVASFENDSQLIYKFNSISCNSQQSRANN